MARSESDRFWSKVSIGSDIGCWFWMGNKAQGYGIFHNAAKKRVPAHRWAYENRVGPIPEGMTLDHLCRNHSCVNPKHLEPVLKAMLTMKRTLTSDRMAGEDAEPVMLKINGGCGVDCENCERMRSELQAAREEAIRAFCAEVGRRAVIEIHKSGFDTDTARWKAFTELKKELLG